jgi:hypothetical protein
MLAETLPRQRFWPTVLWTGLGAIAYLLTQLLGVIIYVAGIRLGHPGQTLSIYDILHSGRAIVDSTILATAMVTVSFWVLTRVRTPAVASYLALRWPDWRRLLISATGFVFFMIGLVVVSRQLEAAGDAAFLREVVSSARDAIPLVIVALTIAAPVGEELVFRGFLYRTLELRFGAVVAVVATALGWASLHIQYSLTGIMVVFAGGLFLGAVRRYSGSLYLTMVLHALWNGVALAGAMLLTSK